MLPLRVPLRQSTWLLFFATAATATIRPSNTSTVDSSRFQGTLPLNHGNGDQTKIADLIPLTRKAAQQSVEGSLRNVNSSSTVATLSDGDVAYINCNNADFPGFVDPQTLFQDAYNRGNISGVILYSTVTDYCDYEPDSSQQMVQEFAVYSMTNQQASASLLNDVSQSSTFPVKVQGRGGDGSGSNNNNNGAFAGQNPLGPSPSTAVAMIILYSITGIITALFLVIIITGAIRAHRHPERYGPRNVLGRPRQSRARGLGRAILETIPIVKFGEKEPAKPTDVELASTAETSRSVNGVTTQGAQTEGTTNATTDAPNTTTTTERTQSRPVSPLEEHQEGIAAATAAAAGKDSSSHDDTLGCSICTEDFEKGQDLRVLPCDHKFHPECVDPWLLNVSGTCPLCRVDLRPVTSNDSSTSHPDGPDSTTTNPPTTATDPDAPETSHHRTAFRDMLSLRYRPNATPQERIFYLRRLRDQRRNRGGEVAEGSSSAGAVGNGNGSGNGNGNGNGEEDRRRSKRMSARFSGVFGGRGRRDRSPQQAQQQQQSGESSRDAPAAAPQTESASDGSASGSGPAPGEGEGPGNFRT